MKIIFRLLFALIIALYLIPSELIELLAIRPAVNGAFLAICAALGIFGLSKIKRQDTLGRFNKCIAFLGIAITCLVGANHLLFGNFYPEGYKFIVIFIMIFTAKELTNVFSEKQTIEDLTAVLAIYIIALAGFLAITGADELLKPTGPGGAYSRLDVTGSVTAMSITATISIFLAATGIASSKRATKKAFLLVVVFSAIYLLMLAASRQAVLIIALYAAIHFFSGKLLSKKAIYKRLAAIGLMMLGAITFVIFSVFVNNSFYVRLFENPSEDYSSGRFNSISLWLDEMRDKGGPLGFGYIKNNTVQEIELLWPHNEFIRFYVEGGAPGLIVILLMFIHAVASLRIVMQSNISWPTKNLVSLIFCVMLVQLSLENFINSIFFSTLCFLLIAVMGQHAYRERSIVTKTNNMQLPESNASTTG